MNTYKYSLDFYNFVIYPGILTYLYYDGIIIFPGILY